MVPVFGRLELTHALLRDVARESALVHPIVVDNGGDYVPWGTETVLRQTGNLGWLRGSNVGVRHALTTGVESLVLLNNDTRLSAGFFAGLHTAAAPRRVGIVGPRYDDHWAHQHSSHVGPASTYAPTTRDRRVDFVDGTCLLVKCEVLGQVGLLDETSFGLTGWGADLDLAVRVRRAGWQVKVTGRSFLRHATASTAVGEHAGAAGYWAAGDRDLRAGLADRWGPDWQRVTGLAAGGVRVRAGRLLGRTR